MLSTQAPDPIAARLKEQARAFLDAFKIGNYDSVWNHLITPEAASLISATAWPCYAHKHNKLDALLTTKIDDFPDVPIHRGLALAFQRDLEEQRTGFFRGVADGFEKMGWYDFSNDDHIAFLEGDGAIFVASTPNIKVLMPFVTNAGGEYKVDFECFQVFSMVLTASSLSNIAKRCLDLGLRAESLAYFELAAALSPAYQRAKRLLADHPVVQQFVTPPYSRLGSNDVRRCAHRCVYGVVRTTERSPIAPPACRDAEDIGLRVAQRAADHGARARLGHTARGGDRRRDPVTGGLRGGNGLEHGES